VGTGFCLVALGLALRAWSAACAGGHTRGAKISAPSLVTVGPYARVRNPIYLGTITLGIGMVLVLGDPWLWPALAAASVLLYATIIPAEERFLAERFGEEYARYCEAVPRLVPRMTPWVRGDAGGRSWQNARGEVVIAGILALILGVLHWSGDGRE
jgi:protein-S-isoprenylcysteine O-methyltransferase Ste14